MTDMPHHQTPDSDETAEADSSRKFWKPRNMAIVIAIVLFVAIGAWLLASVPDRLLQHWFSDMDSEERAKFLGQAANVVLFSLGGVIALVGVGLSLARKAEESEAAERDVQRLAHQQAQLIHDRERYEQQRNDDRERYEQQRNDDRERYEQQRNDDRERYKQQRNDDRERELRSRFVTLVGLLADDAPTTRQAALYGLAALADDWQNFERPDETQVCIDVICAYLRAPLSEGIDSTPAPEISVKQAGISVIRSHLHRNSHPSWQTMRIDLSRMTIDFPLNLQRIEIGSGGGLLLTRAVVSSTLDFTYAKINRNAHISLSHAKFHEGSQVIFRQVQNVGGLVLLNRAHIEQGVTFRCSRLWIRDQGRVSFGRATIAEGAILDFWNATIDDDGLIFDGAIIHEGGVVDLSRIAGGDVERNVRMRHVQGDIRLPAE